MNFILNSIGQIALLLVSTAVFTFIVWRLKKRKTDFGEFVGKYGELIGYLGLFLVVLIIGIIQFLTSDT